MERYVFRGTSREIGLKHGQSIKNVFADHIRAYLTDGMFKHGIRDKDKALLAVNPFLESLPDHFREELYAFAEGVGLPVEQVALWHCEYLGLCSTLVAFNNGKAWTGHNVDYANFGSYRWSSAMVIERKGRIPILNLALCGDLHSYQGINKAQLWIHSNYLPAVDRPRQGRTIPWLFFIREALETCENIADVEMLITNYDRDMGVALTVIDGKTNESVIFECSRSSYRVLYPNGDLLLVTNHFQNDAAEISKFSENGSIRRYKRLQELTKEKYPRSMDDFVKILADAEVEQRGKYEGTYQAVVASPALREIWFACDAYPAASRGTFQRIQWPWDESFS